jgi:hypothetical protein
VAWAMLWPELRCWLSSVAAWAALWLSLVAALAVLLPEQRCCLICTVGWAVLLPEVSLWLVIGATNVFLQNGLCLGLNQPDCCQCCDKAESSRHDKLLFAWATATLHTSSTGLAVSSPDYKAESSRHEKLLFAWATATWHTSSTGLAVSSPGYHGIDWHHFHRWAT